MGISLLKPATGPWGDLFGPRAFGFHHGVDIGWYLKAPDFNVVAAADGKVSSVFVSSMLGNVIVITHNAVYQTLYAHLRSVKVKQGVTVERGDSIGVMGETGSQANGVHLHFVLLERGVQIDPMPHFTTTAGGGEIIDEENGAEMYRLIKTHQDADQDKNRYDLFTDFGVLQISYAEASAYNEASTLPNSIDGTKPDAEVTALRGLWAKIIASNKAALTVPTGGTVPANAATKSDVDAVGNAVAGVSKQIAALPQAPTASEIAKAVNDDAAARLKS